MNSLYNWFTMILLFCSMGLMAQNSGGDNCASATPLGTIGGPSSCPGGAGFVGENTDLALPSTLNPSCDQFGTNYDLWYSFVAPSTGVIQINIDLGTASRVEAAVWSSCQNEIYCNSSNSDGAMVMGLNPGQTYFLQLWTDAFTRGSFDFCLFEKPNRPPNDSCTGAIMITTMNSMDPCISTGGATLLNNFGVESSGETPLPSCGNFGMGMDAWYTFVVPASGNVVIEMTEAMGPQDWAFSVYEGSCGSLVEVECDDDDGNQLKPKIELTGRTPGTILFLRVWEIGGDGFGSYRIAVMDPNTTPPVNNDCANAIDITNNLMPTGGCNPICGHNMNSTPSGETPAPGCSLFGAGNDVWYKMTIPDAGGLNIEMSAFSTSGPQDWAMAAYSGTCGSLTRVACDDDSGPSLYPRLALRGLTPGEEIFIRVWEFQSDEEGPFDICLTPQQPLALTNLEINIQSTQEGNWLTWSSEQPELLTDIAFYRSEDSRNWTMIHERSHMDFTPFLDDYPMNLLYYYAAAKAQDGTTVQSEMIAVEKSDRETETDELLVFPVPSRDMIRVNWNQFTQNEEVQCQIFDLQGRLLSNHNLLPIGGQVQLPIEDLSTGTYLIQVRAGDQVAVTKVIKE